MKNGKLPTRSQKAMLKSHGLDPDEYLIVKNTSEYTEVVSRMELKRIVGRRKPRTRKLYKIDQVVIETRAVKKQSYSKLGKVIKKKLIDKNMSARELAEALGTTPQYLNKILHGERSGEKYLQAIRDILEIDAA